MGFRVTARCGLLVHPSSAGVARRGYLLPPLVNNVPHFIVGFLLLGVVVASPRRGANCSLIPA